MKNVFQKASSVFSPIFEFHKALDSDAINIFPLKILARLILNDDMTMKVSVFPCSLDLIPMNVSHFGLQFLFHLFIRDGNLAHETPGTLLDLIVSLYLVGLTFSFGPL